MTVTESNLVVVKLHDVFLNFFISLRHATTKMTIILARNFIFDGFSTDTSNNIPIPTSMFFRHELNPFK